MFMTRDDSIRIYEAKRVSTLHGMSIKMMTAGNVTPPCIGEPYLSLLIERGNPNPNTSYFDGGILMLA